MAIVRVFAGMESGIPWLEFRNDRDKEVQVLRVSFHRGVEGSCPYFALSEPLKIRPEHTARISGEELDSVQQSLESKLSSLLQPGEPEAVIRIRIDLEPQQAEHDQPAPSFYVVRAENGRITDFFPLQGSLQGQPSMLGALLEDRRHGT